MYNFYSNSERNLCTIIFVTPSPLPLRVVSCEPLKTFKDRRLKIAIIIIIRILILFFVRTYLSTKKLKADSIALSFFCFIR